MLQDFKHQITCITMYENVFLPLQQDFYSKSRHMSPPQNSSQIYAYEYESRVQKLEEI